MNSIPTRFIQNVKTTPIEVTQYSQCRAHYADLIATIKVIKTTESVQLTEQEAIGLFGKTYKMNITKTLRNHHIRKPKVVLHNGIVYISNCEI